LLEREVTLAEILKDAGYATAHMGKWHLGLPQVGKTNKPTPDKHGFDYWFATANNASPSHRNPNNFIRNGKPVGEITGYSSHIVVDEAITWLNNIHDKKSPFFLNIWFHEPHAPIAAPDSIVKIYNNDPDGAVYSATIDNTDRAVTRLLKKLAQVAPVENTLIIYSSDNGSYRNDRTGSLRGKKTINYEGGLRVPGIFSWPGKIPVDKTMYTPAGVVDILPTICSLLKFDLPVNRHLDGTDLSPLLTGDGKDFVRPQPFFWHLQLSTPIVAMRDGKYSLVAFRDNSSLSKNNLLEEAWIPMIKEGGYINYQLFDLGKDPNQKQDISDQLPVKLEELKKKLLEINASVMAEGTDWHLQ